MILKFYVKYQTLYLLSRDPVVADSSGYLQANFQFTEDWDGTNKTAQFKRTESDLITDGKPLFFNEEIDNNGNCIIPWEVLKGEGTFNVNVFGQKTESDGTTVKTITVNSLDIRVGQSGLTTNEFPQDSTPNQYDNIYEEIQKAGKKTQASQTAAAASQAAAKTSETNASTSATNAANSATSSANSATAAANSATAAATSEINAKASETAALASQKATSTSETNAKTSETNATSSATAAATSEKNAKASETAASASETNAKTSETNAASSATASASSASAAKTSENNAASSKTAAATSATNAANSAKAAADSATAAANSARVNQADWNQTDDTRTDFIKNKPQNLKNIGDTDAINLYSFFKDDNAGNPVYMLMQELASYSPNSNLLPAPTSYGFNGIVYGKLRRGNGYDQLMALVTVNLGYEYNFLYSSSNHYRPVVVKDEASNKYYWAMMACGSSQDVIMFGQFTKAPLFTKIMATDRQGTLPSGWSLIHDAKTYELPRTIVAKAVSDRNGAQIDTTYLKKEDAQQSITTNTLTATDATFTGQTIVPTANEGNSSNAIASTEFVAKSIAALVNSAPETLNTLNELATALGNDPNFATTVTAELAKKLNSTEAESTYATKTEAGVPYQIKRNTAYKVGDVLTSPSLPPGCVIVVTQAGTTGSTEPDWATIKSNIGGVIADNTVTFYINDTLSKHSVGDIVYKPLTKVTEHEYLLPLDGQTIDGTAYKRLVDYLGTNVLPNLNGRYLRADSTPGTMVEAGLPNITGSFGGGSGSGGSTGNGSGIGFLRDSMMNGCCRPQSKGYGNETGVGGGTLPSGYPVLSANIDASWSSPIYGKSTTVTPLTYTVRAYICYA